MVIRRSTASLSRAAVQTITLESDNDGDSSTTAVATIAARVSTRRRSSSPAAVARAAASVAAAAAPARAAERDNDDDDDELSRLRRCAVEAAYLLELVEPPTLTAGGRVFEQSHRMPNAIDDAARQRAVDAFTATFDCRRSHRVDDRVAFFDALEARGEALTVELLAQDAAAASAEQKYAELEHERTRRLERKRKHGRRGGGGDDDDDNVDTDSGDDDDFYDNSTLRKTLASIALTPADRIAVMRAYASELRHRHQCLLAALGAREYYPAIELRRGTKHPHKSLAVPPLVINEQVAHDIRREQRIASPNYDALQDSEFEFNFEDTSSSSSSSSS
jgi:hypothetical protein